MNKHHFTLMYKGETYKCHIEETGEVCVINKAGSPQVIARVNGDNYRIESVKEIVIEKLDCLGL